MSKRLTRAELKLALAVMQGFKLEWLEEWKQWQLTDVNGKRWVFGRSSFDFLPTPEKRLEWALNLNPKWDPTLDIAASWALKDWVNEHCSEEVKLRLWNAFYAFSENLAGLSAQEAAFWICCAVYFAVTGERVEIVEREGETQ